MLPNFKRLKKIWATNEWVNYQPLSLPSLSHNVAMNRTVKQTPNIKQSDKCTRSKDVWPAERKRKSWWKGRATHWFTESTFKVIFTKKIFNKIFCQCLVMVTGNLNEPMKTVTVWISQFLQMRKRKEKAAQLHTYTIANILLHNHIFVFALKIQVWLSM